jgi:hypothetical protein
MIENLIAQDGAPQLGAAARRDAAFRLRAIPDRAVARVDRSPDSMKSHRTLEFQSSPAGPTGGWRVQIRIGVEHVQYIYGFDTQFDADEWIEREAEEWMKLLDAS